MQPIPEGGNRRARIWAFISALGLAGLCGWGYLHLITPLEYLGLAGGIAYFLISQSNSEDGIAKILLEVLKVAVNTIVFFFIIRFVQVHIFPRRQVN
jgi:uncharacterized membrane protein YccC